jgi:two-component system, cell cycle response regulator DivK
MPLRVLIVDDNERNRKLARDVLQAAGLETLEAATGAEAIALADGQVPDVVLLDLRLPDSDGSDVLRELRNRPRTARIPVVALSAVPGGDWLHASGFSGYIEKPITVAEFPEQVRRYCGPVQE